MADAFEDETEQTVSIQEYLKNVEDEELEADLVLGGDEGKECTYNNGYMKRQAIFSCLTCNPDGNAGVCTACSLSCHDGHEIVELWTKRNFRCDCGNSKFGVFYCKLFANKDPENLGNSYNQNFKGAYCTCGRPYPDPDAEEQVEMIQCCVCEDWFHETHLGLESPDELPRDEEGEPSYEDFICQGCVKKCSFLTLYPPVIWAPNRQFDASQSSDMEGTVSAGTVKLGNGTVTTDTPKIDTVITDAAPEMAVDSKVVVSNEKSDGIVSAGIAKLGNGTVTVTATADTPIIDTVTTDAATVVDSNVVVSNEKSEAKVGLADPTQSTVSSPKCILGVNPRETTPHLEKIKPMFLSKNWRGLLCKCETCGNLYAERGLSFLVDSEDSIAVYEETAKQKRQEKLQEQEGAELNFLNKLGHVQKFEILNGINDMKNEFQSFLQSVDSSKPITPADVQQIFENLAKKRQRLQ